MKTILNKAWLAALVFALLLGKNHTIIYAAGDESIITEDSLEQEDKEELENKDDELPDKADIVFSDLVYPPDSMIQGSTTALGGSISSEALLTSVVISISSVDGETIYSSYTVNPNDYTYSIDANATDNLKINKLSVGTYKYTITASNADDVTKEVEAKQFMVVEKADITIQNAAYPPSKLAFGKSVTLKGTVSSKAILTSVKIKVISQNGKRRITVMRRNRMQKVSLLIPRSIKN